MSLEEEKKILRNKIKQLKSLYSFEQKKIKSGTILHHLQNEEIFKNSKVIMLYWALPDEVYTHDFIITWANEKKIILPSVKGDHLLLKEFQGIKNLVAGENFGISEPSGIFFSSPEEIDLIIVPGIAFDRNRNRMGRGKAYYDKLLADTSAYKVGICFDFQLFDRIPSGQMDIPMDKIISETEVI